MVLLQKKNHWLLRFPQHCCKCLFLLTALIASLSGHVCFTSHVRMHWLSRLWRRHTDNSKCGSNKLSFSLQGCTKGPHNKEKPPEPVKPEVKSSAEKKDIDDQKPKFNEYIISAPKPQEAIQRPRYVCGDAVTFLLLFFFFLFYNIVMRLFKCSGVELGKKISIKATKPSVRHWWDTR